MKGATQEKVWIVVVQDLLVNWHPTLEYSEKSKINDQYIINGSLLPFRCGWSNFAVFQWIFAFFWCLLLFFKPIVLPFHEFHQHFSIFNCTFLPISLNFQTIHFYIGFIFPFFNLKIGTLPSIPPSFEFIISLSILMILLLILLLLKRYFLALVCRPSLKHLPFFIFSLLTLLSFFSLTICIFLSSILTISSLLLMLPAVDVVPVLFHLNELSFKYYNIFIMQK